MKQTQKIQTWWGTPYYIHPNIHIPSMTYLHQHILGLLNPRIILSPHLNWQSWSFSPLETLLSCLPERHMLWFSVLVNFPYCSCCVSSSPTWPLNVQLPKGLALDSYLLHSFSVNSPRLMALNMLILHTSPAQTLPLKSNIQHHAYIFNCLLNISSPKSNNHGP